MKIRIGRHKYLRSRQSKKVLTNCTSHIHLSDETAIDIKIPTTPPPIQPSHDLLGETDSKSFLFPIALPTKYAPASLSQSMIKVPSIIKLELASVFIKIKVSTKGMIIYPIVERAIGVFAIMDCF